MIIAEHNYKYHCIEGNMILDKNGISNIEIIERLEKTPTKMSSLQKKPKKITFKRVHFKIMNNVVLVE